MRPFFGCFFFFREDEKKVHMMAYEEWVLRSFDMLLTYKPGL